MAIANELKLGNLLIKNVQFNLTEGNDIILGNSLLRLIPQFSIESQKLVLMQQVQSFTNSMIFMFNFPASASEILEFI